MAKIVLLFQATQCHPRQRLYPRALVAQPWAGVHAKVLIIDAFELYTECLAEFAIVWVAHHLVSAQAKLFECQRVQCAKVREPLLIKSELRHGSLLSLVRRLASEGQVSNPLRWHTTRQCALYNPKKTRRLAGSRWA